MKATHQPTPRLTTDPMRPVRAATRSRHLPRQLRWTPGKVLRTARRHRRAVPTRLLLRRDHDRRHRPMHGLRHVRLLRPQRQPGNHRRHPRDARLRRVHRPRVPGLRVHAPSTSSATGTTNENDRTLAEVIETPHGRRKPLGDSTSHRGCPVSLSYVNQALDTPQSVRRPPAS